MLDRETRVPLYYQLKQALTKLIEESFQPGDLLPTEAELESRFGVSRMTVRLATNALVEEGLIIKQRGRGTFVQSPKIAHQFHSITSWTQEMQARGLTPHTQTYEAQVMEAPRRVAQALQMDASERVFRIRRVRYADDQPMAIMINYLRTHYVPDLIRTGLVKESLYAQLVEQDHLHLIKAQETIEARESSEEEAEVLHISPYAPVLFVTRVSYVPKDIPVELVFLTSRADRYHYQLWLKATEEGVDDAVDR
jgi:GntR family transcriptional regulator